ncbi:lipase class 3 [Tolypothrix sp. NIES-4075]|uniref:lipase family protein n=1 Tax=Tolypothrix sp. NIES-4075 TaxID=2005459 RepID=UPI000B5C9D04|nr:hypothetical protein [Tolypothrix sp. NIES-4075]GAX44133.1 lipase class 3 [Tolypothrix sp. NIES-4075]
MEQVVTLNETQKILTLGWIINGLSGYGDRLDPLRREEMELLLTERIDQRLNDSIVQKYIGKWERVWGPFVYLAPPPFNRFATNAIYVARQGNQYVIGIAGTNFKSIHNWFIEDFYVGAQAEWAEYADTKPPGLPPKISLGTKIGLDNLLKEHPGTKTNIIDFFKEQLKEADEEADEKVDKVEIVVTGHSLGGALSPVLALALHEKKSTWDPNSRAKLKVFPFAGPTPGNLAFAIYYDLRLGINTTRVWNNLDIVPHAWNQEMLKKIPTLYEPEIPSNPLIEWYVNIGKFLSLLGTYTNVKALTPALEGEFRPPVPAETSQTSSKQVELNVQLSESLKSALTANEELSVSDEVKEGFNKFMAQALEQHIAAYFDLLDFPTELKEFLLTPLSASADPEATESLITKLLEYSANPDVAH